MEDEKQREAQILDMEPCECVSLLCIDCAVEGVTAMCH